MKRAADGVKSGNLVATVAHMVTVERESSAASFAVVRRGFDPVQVTKHLDRLDADMKILAADRAAAVEQAAQLGKELDTARSELDAARAEAERLRNELRVMSGPPDSVGSMSERLQVMLRLAQDEFGEMRAAAAAHAAAHAAEIIAAVGEEAGHEFDPSDFDSSENGYAWTVPDTEREIDRMRREAAEERARLDEAAVMRRAKEDEEFRKTLVLRCREAMAQIAKLQSESLRTAQRVIEDADKQAKTVLAETRDTVRRTVDEAQREVDDLHGLRDRLAKQLDTSRQLLERAMPEAAKLLVQVPDQLSVTPDPAERNGLQQAEQPAQPAAQPVEQPAAQQEEQVAAPPAEHNGEQHAVQQQPEQAPAQQAAPPVQQQPEYAPAQPAAQQAGPPVQQQPEYAPVQAAAQQAEPFVPQPSVPQPSVSQPSVSQQAEQTGPQPVSQAAEQPVSRQPERDHEPDPDGAPSMPTPTLAAPVRYLPTATPPPSY